MASINLLPKETKSQNFGRDEIKSIPNIPKMVFLPYFMVFLNLFYLGVVKTLYYVVKLGIRTCNPNFSKALSNPTEPCLTVIGITLLKLLVNHLNVDQDQTPTLIQIDLGKQ